MRNSHAYYLPRGLDEGDAVKLVQFDRGFWQVEKDGRRFEVFLCCVETGYEYELAENRWLPESDWRVQARLREPNEQVSERAKLIANSGCIPDAA